MIRIKWPIAIATVFVVLLGSYLLYTQLIVRALRSEVRTLSQIFSEVQGGLTSLDPGRELEALQRLQDIVIASEVPLVMTGPSQGLPARDSVLAFANLPFEATVETVDGLEQILDYVARLDARHAPVGDSLVQLIHFGDTPDIARLSLIPWLLVTGLLLTVAVGFTLIQTQRRAESEKAWTSMARELAHQMGTPISSLQGWLEVIRLPPDERPGDVGDAEIASAIEEDLVRLERVSHRFELIGREPELGNLDLTVVTQDLERYISIRLPRFGPGVTLTVDVPKDLPNVKGSAVLLVWALENLVKNSLDALAGRGGAIKIIARWEGRWVAVRISDNGPGVELDVRDRLFDPGVSTKSGGWGVGLALTRRIVEGVHGGRIELLDSRDPGATFQVLLPVSG